jgi:hypothetical protein
MRDAGKIKHNISSGTPDREEEGDSAVEGKSGRKEDPASSLLFSSLSPHFCHHP